MARQLVLNRPGAARPQQQLGIRRPQPGLRMQPERSTGGPLRTNVPQTGGPLTTNVPQTGGPLTTTQPAPVAPPPAAPVSTDQNFRGVQDFMDKSAVDPQYKSTYSFMSDYKPSPLYDFQMQKGQQALNRLMASRGLLKSGAENQANVDLINELNAKEGDRAMSVASQDANRFDNIQGSAADRANAMALNNAQRFDQNSRDIADRAERAGGNQWGRMMDVLRFQGEQNPMSQAYDALTKFNSLNLDRGKAQSQYQTNNYARVRPRPVASSGGGGSMPGYAPSAPPLDTSNIDIMRLMAGQNTRDNIMGGLGGALSAIGNLFG